MSEQGESKEPTLVDVMFLQLGLAEMYGQLMALSSLVEASLREMPPEQVARIFESAEAHRAQRWSKMGQPERPVSEDYMQAMRDIGEVGATMLVKMRERLDAPAGDGGGEPPHSS